MGSLLITMVVTLLIAGVLLWAIDAMPWINADVKKMIHILVIVVGSDRTLKSHEKTQETALLVADFRQHDRRKRKRRVVKDTFNNIIFRTKRSIERELDKTFPAELTTKSL